MKNYLLFLGDHGYYGPTKQHGGGGEQTTYTRKVQSGDLTAQTFVFGHGEGRHEVANSTILSNYGGSVKRATLNRNKSELDIFVVAGASADDKVGNNWTVESTTKGEYIATGNNTVAGKRYKMPATVTDCVAADGDDFVIKKVAGEGSSADDGFELAVGDVVEMKIGAGSAGRDWIYDYSFMVCYPEDAFLNVQPTSATTTDVKFRAHQGTQGVDIVSIQHASGKNKEVADLIAACLHSGTQGNKYAGACLVMDTFRGITYKGLGESAGILGYTIAINQ